MNKITVFGSIFIILLLMACDTNNDSGVFWTPHINGRPVYRFTGNAILMGTVGRNSNYWINAGRIENGRVFIELPSELDDSYLSTEFFDWLLSIIGDGTVNPFSRTKQISFLVDANVRCVDPDGNFLPSLHFEKYFSNMGKLQWHQFFFIYFSEDTAVTGSGFGSSYHENTYIEININVRRGWNIIYDSMVYDGTNPRRHITSNIRNAPSDMRWEIISGN